MNIEYPAIILSDLHFGHPASLVADPDQLIPLFRDVKTVIFNGDTVEQLSSKTRENADRSLQRIRRVCDEIGVIPVFLTGNHDPEISQLGHLDLCKSAILVTHGDILFHQIAPWSKDAQKYADAREKILGELEEDALTKLEHHLVATKKASLMLKMHIMTMNRGLMAQLAVWLRECWPPWRPLRIIGFWAQTPGRVECLARMFRPHARFIITGHTHYKGVWRRGDRIVINTGSFISFFRRQVVVIDDKTLSVRKVKRKNSRFYIGSKVVSFPIKKLQPHELF